MNPTHGTGEDSAANNSARNEAALPREDNVAVCQDGLKSRLRKRFLKEGTEASSQENVFYVRSTGLSVTEDSLDPEPRNRTISCENIFMGQTKRGDPIRTVLTKGVGGIGKTLLTQRFSLDWVEGRTNQDIQLLFLCTFRELTVVRRTYSLVELLHYVFSESVGILNFEHLSVLFIFDGLDERNSPLDFTQTRVLTDPTEPASVDVLLVNLIRGSLLPSARLWITTRPAAANRIPAECVSMVTEMRGFTDAHKEQYFRKRFSDAQQATAVISNIRTSYGLYSMSHIPAVCEIISTVLHKVIETRGMEQLPQTLTQMCIHVLLVQMDNIDLKYKELFKNVASWKNDMGALGCQAFEHLQKGQWIFYESEMMPNLNLAICTNLVSEMYPQIFRQEDLWVPEVGFGRGKRGPFAPPKAYFFIQCFQEFLAAYYIHFLFQNRRLNLLSTSQPSLIKIIFNRKLKHLLRSAVDQILSSPDENTDLFLCFVLGLSLPTNQSLLQVLQTQTGSSSLVNQEIVKYISKKLNECQPLERRKSLFYCLNEMNDQRLLEEVQKSMGEGRLSKNMSPAHWSTLAFLILSSDLEEFNLRNYCPSEDALLNLLLVVKSYSTVILSHCNLSKKSCGPLSSVLCSSTLRHLDLSNNNILDSGVRKLCSGLKSAPCRLETLILSCCSLSQGSCGPLSSVLCSSSLRHLDLSNNGLQDSGLKLMCSGLKSTPCRLEILRLSGCQVSVEGGTALALALKLSLFHLRELDLRYNHLGPSVQHLTALRDDPQCPLNTLR
uniref:NACHT domain-containing protein n=1 Tax=Neogobius melanostomus TaxID=47308 RepID=A0A8C6T3C2_9GOBI